MVKLADVIIALFYLVFGVKSAEDD